MTMQSSLPRPKSGVLFAALVTTLALCTATVQAQTGAAHDDVPAKALTAPAAMPSAAGASAPAWTPAQLAELDAADQRASAARKLEHDRIRHERGSIKAKLRKDEAACYQQFAVEDCLRTVRADVRQAEGRLRVQEIELNDAERKEKAAARLRSIEEKQRIKPASVEPVIRKPNGAGRQAPKAAPSLPEGSVQSVPLRDPQELKAQRDQDAQRRAEQQRSRLQAHEAQQFAREASQSDRAAKARERHEQAQKAAQEHRERAENAQAQALAAGRKPAAPLPTGAASAFQPKP